VQSTAAHLADHVSPHLPVRQWVLRHRTLCKKLQKQYLTILIKLRKLCSSQGGVALRRGVVNTEILANKGFPGATGACRKTGTSKTFAAMAEVPLSKSRPFVLTG
jgi:hypothetical protein